MCERDLPSVVDPDRDPAWDDDVMGAFDVAIAPEVEMIPPGLDAMEPGPTLAAFLAATDVSRLSGHDRIVVLQARQRMASHYAAQVYGDMVAVTDSLRELEDQAHPRSPSPRRRDAARQRLARSLRANGETRTMDQLRADVLLEGTGMAGRSSRGVVDIRVDLATLTQLSDAPGQLAGCGPVIADIARQVAAARRDAEWRVVVTDPDTGDVVHDSTTRRRPTVGQRRYVAARQSTCVFPGCRMPAAGCDLDHINPYAQRRRTTVRDLAPMCRHDHVTVRHGCGWTYHRMPDGDHKWTSRLRHSYLTSSRPP